MKWPELLSTLWTQTHQLSLRDFQILSGLDLQDPTQLSRHTENEKLKLFLFKNPEWWRAGERILRWIEKNSARLTYPGHHEYPSGLLELESPPVFLSYFGSPCWTHSGLLSVVGSRSPASSTLQWMELELTSLVEKGAVLVSGGAIGVDQRAHRISMRNGKPTVAFLPSGLGQTYPSSFQSWIDPILESGGAVLSELDPLEAMKKHYFLKRNRMIAAISPITLIVEARRQSGTLITARLACENSRTVGVVPGLPCDPRWSGSLDLLSDGAILVRDQWDIITLANWVSPSGPVFS